MVNGVTFITGEASHHCPYQKRSKNPTKVDSILQLLTQDGFLPGIGEEFTKWMTRICIPWMSSMVSHWVIRLDLHITLFDNYIIHIKSICLTITYMFEYAHNWKWKMILVINVLTSHFETHTSMCNYIYNLFSEYELILFTIIRVYKSSTCWNISQNMW